MTPLPILLLTLALGADPAPAAVTKAPAPPAPVWVEIQADPLGTRLESASKSTWTVVDSGCAVWPAADGKSAVFVAVAPARYKVLVTSEKGEVTHVAVTVGTPEPTPPKPGPVDPPVPQSELGKKLQAAFDADPTPKDKKLAVLALKAELYKQAADLAGSPDVTSTGQLVTRVKDASKALGVDGLPAVRQVIAAVLAEAMPTDEPMTADLRTKAAAAFQRIRSALLEVK